MINPNVVIVRYDASRPGFGEISKGKPFLYGLPVKVSPRQLNKLRFDATFVEGREEAMSFIIGTYIDLKILKQESSVLTPESIMSQLWALGVDALQMAEVSDVKVFQSFMFTDRNVLLLQDTPVADRSVHGLIIIPSRKELFKAPGIGRVETLLIGDKDGNTKKETTAD